MKNEKKKNKGKSAPQKKKSEPKVQTAQLTFDFESGTADVSEKLIVTEEEEEKEQPKEEKRVEKKKDVKASAKKEKKPEEKRDERKKRGLPKYLAFWLVETTFLFLIELILKLIVGNFTTPLAVVRLLISSMFASTILTIIANNMPKVPKMIIVILVDFILTLYAWLQIGFLNFMGLFMSLGNANQGARAIEYIVDFISSYDWSTHLIFVPLIAVIVYLAKEEKLGFDKERGKIKFRNIRHVLAMIGTLFILAGCYYGTLVGENEETMENFLHPKNAVLGIRDFGSSVYLVLDLKNLFTDTPHSAKIVVTEGEDEDYGELERVVDEEAWESLLAKETDPDYKALNEFFSSRQITPKNNYTGLFEGKNLVMVMLESVGEGVFHDEFKEYFPTLNKLYHEGLTGQNNYSPMNNCGTGESERTSQTSIYSIETLCTVNTYKENEYPYALLNMFKKNGYFTSTYHNFDDRYYDRSTYEYKLGAMKYYSSRELGIELSNQYKEWPGDRELVEKAVPNFVEQSKFASYLITVSAHTPYIFDSEISSRYISLFDETDYSLPIKRYLAKVKEVDLAIEELMGSLEKAGKLDNTVIVLFGDHYPYALGRKSYETIAPYDIEENNAVDRTPFIIYNSEMKAEKITKYTSPMDYTPTLLNLFGIDYDPRLYLGHDVFSEYDDYVLFQDNSWLSSKGFYNMATGTFTAVDGVAITESEITRINEELLGMRNVSTLAIEKNYFEYLDSYFKKINNMDTEE